MNKSLEFIKQNKTNLILLIIWTVIVSVTMFHHEIWRDEAQVWLLARDCNLVKILKHIRIECHPILWYLLVFPFAKSGCDIFSMQILSLIFVFVGVAYLLIKSPFNYLMKTVFIFSAGMVYYLPVIARNYALIPIFIFMLAELYPRKGESYKHPYLFAILLILLSNTHLFMLIFCIALAAFFTWNQLKLTDKTFKTLLPVILIILNFIILISLFINVPYTNSSILNYYNEYGQSIISALKEFPLLFFQYPFTSEKFININICSFYIILGILLIKFFQKDKKLFICTVSTLIYFFILYKQIWYAGIDYQKTFLFFLVIIFCYWIINKTEKDKFLTILIFFVFFISSIPTPYCIYKEIKHNFSEAKQLAEYIKQNLNDEKEFILNSNIYPAYYTSIIAYLRDKKFYFLQYNRYITYFDFSVTQNEKQVEKSNAKYVICLKEYNIEEEPEYDYELVYETDFDDIGIYIKNLPGIGENFAIYKRIKKETSE